MKKDSIFGNEICSNGESKNYYDKNDKSVFCSHHRSIIELSRYVFSLKKESDDENKKPVNINILPGEEVTSKNESLPNSKCVNQIS